MKLTAFALITASLALLLFFWLTAGIPHGGSEIAACVFTNWLYGVFFPAVGVWFWKRADQ